MLRSLIVDIVILNISTKSDQMIFSPDKLIRSHRCSGFCLPSSAHCLKNENKLSMEIRCQLFWNKQYKLLNNYVKLTWRKNWRCIHKDPNVHIVLLDFRITKIHGDKHTLIKTIHLAKYFPILQPKWVTLWALHRFNSKSISWWVLRCIFFVSKFSWSSKPILSKT